jgi:N-acetylglucosamine-6-phosphate deacetylase
MSTVPKIVLKGNLVLPDAVIPRGTVLIEGQKIKGIYTPHDRFQDAEAQSIDYGEAYIAPGFVDLHLHGAVGKDVMDGRQENMRAIVEYEARNGVMAFLASTMSASLEAILQTIKVVRKVAEDPLPSSILGIHVEGPFVNEQKKGAHSASYIKGVTEKDSRKLIDALREWRAIFSIAPEVGKNMRWIAELKAAGFVVAIGHSNATYDQALESFGQGITHATHLYNAMSGFGHREPGVVGAVLDSEDVTAELIADGVHVHPAALRLAVAKKGTDRICLVTDSMLATGMGDGVYKWDGKEIIVRGDKATIRESGILAGSVLTLRKAVKNMIDWTSVTLSEAINMASLNPARVLGMEKEIGSIQSGKLADLVVLDRDFRIVEAISKGKPILRRGERDDP